MAVKKQWYSIIAPKLFGEMVVGETITADPKKLVGRVIELSLSDIDRDYSKFFVKVKFQVDNVDGNKVNTKFMGHSCMRERIYRMIQRRVRKVESIQDVKTKDGVSVRIKTVFVLIRRVNTSVKNAARKKTRELVKEATENAAFEDLIRLIIKGKVQRDIRKEISKIYPVGDLEIRETKVLKG